MKTCTKCGEAKGLEAFAKRAASKDGLQHQCKACKSKLHAAYREDNTDQLAAYKHDYYSANRAAIRSKNKLWQNENAGRVRAIIGRHEAKRELRQPAWVVGTDCDAVYASARRVEQCLGIQMHVDHVIPKCGKLVSGLHVPSNLQVIPAKQNLSKNNRFDPNTHEEPIWHRS